ncbi:dihydrofolate reductase family protein [Hoyosella altamirensis]|uniref:Dihydrofolate reductase n=1 Tax=Hoyosella altamirensis TaxID=616997 RepID=A0A839RL95_9ACTN|nr:dihydrofolate reductase family protein [Hoyosella altamirensis]MBB3036833.1 dihydrofolate reductase [Hoyosella altamirensis]
MSRTQFYTATSLDGFIATSDDSLAWLLTRAHDEDGPLNYNEFFRDVGAMAMGSTTYEWVINHEFKDKDPADWVWPYSIPGWVFTHRDLPVIPNSNITFVRDDVGPVHQQMMEAAAGQNVWIVGGGDLAGQFADAGLLDELIVYLAPVTLGAGKPLMPRHLELKVEEVGRNGEFACARYSVVR